MKRQNLKSEFLEQYGNLHKTENIEDFNKAIRESLNDEKINSLLAHLQFLMINRTKIKVDVHYIPDLNRVIQKIREMTDLLQDIYTHTSFVKKCARANGSLIRKNKKERFKAVRINKKRFYLSPENQEKLL